MPQTATNRIRENHIYTTSAQLTAAVAAQSNKPAISSNGVLNGASFQPVISGNTYVTINGTNLAAGAQNVDRR